MKNKINSGLVDFLHVEGMTAKRVIKVGNMEFILYTEGGISPKKLKKQERTYNETNNKQKTSKKS